jgi:hypothetical protein
MGLDVVVFRNAKNLQQEFGWDLFDVDKATGEALPKDAEHKIPQGKLFAIERRLGNISEIARLRESVGELLRNQESILQSRVLYSGSHSGDSIPLNKLPQVREEIALLKSYDRPELSTFIGAMEAVMDAAETEGNPIVFV